MSAFTNTQGVTQLLLLWELMYICENQLFTSPNDGCISESLLHSHCLRNINIWIFKSVQAGFRIRIRFVLRGWIRIRSISDLIRNPASQTNLSVRLDFLCTLIDMTACLFYFINMMGILISNSRPDQPYFDSKYCLVYVMHIYRYFVI